MKLSDKILYCRKKAGLSQEALAEKLNVSRQAVSKWETGEALPDLNNIVTIAKEFGVTTDWLLSEDEPEQSPIPEKAQPSPRPHRNGRNSFMKRAWIIGLVIALLGIPVTIEGAIMTAFAGNTAAIGKGFTQSVTVYDEYGNAIRGAEDMFGFDIGMGAFGDAFGATADAITSTTTGMINIFTAIGIVILVLGIIMIAGGTVSAIILKKKANRIQG